MKRRNQPPVHPFAPLLLVLIAVAVMGSLYWAFGIGKEALTYLAAMLLVLATPVVLILRVAGSVLSIRRLFRGAK